MHVGRDSEIVTTQVAPHDDLTRLVKRYQSTTFARPIGEPTKQAYQHIVDWLGEYRGDIILDSCCGVGESTSALAQRFPKLPVIGVDKSALRTGKHLHYRSDNNNYLVLRADVIDLWRLLHDSPWAVSHHYLLYPNPYPKPRQVQKRWHAGPSLPALIALGGQLEVRSNWDVYIQEFAQALGCYNVVTAPQHFTPDAPITPFERKYHQSGQTLWRLNADLTGLVNVR